MLSKDADCCEEQEEEEKKGKSSGSRSWLSREQALCVLVDDDADNGWTLVENASTVSSQGCFV